MNQTIDLDMDSKKQVDIHVIARIIEKICMNPCLKDIIITESNSKGFHAELICTKENCELCRMVYDDQIRFAKDSMRPKYAQNVLFTKKGISIKD